MKEKYGLKPQDILVLLKLISNNSDERLHQSTMAIELGLSSSEVNQALARLRGSRLINSDRKPIRPSVVEFILAGVKYVYPASPGAITRGMPTAHSAPPLNLKFKTATGDIYVWPDPEGEVSGQAVTPLYPSVPIASKKDQRLYEMLALIDAIRVGRAREVEAAKEDLKQRLRGRI